MMRWIKIACCIVPALALIAGCGGSDSNNGQPGDYTGNYTGSSPISATRTGTLAMTVLATGQTSAFLSIAGNNFQGSRVTRPLSIDPGLPNSVIYLLGKSTFNDGHFVLSGQTNNEDVTVSGTLPQGTRSTKWTLKIGTGSASGTLTVGGPGAPTTGNTTTGNTTTGNTTTGNTTTGNTTTGNTTAISTGTTGTTETATTGTTLTTGIATGTATGTTAGATTTAGLTTGTT